MKHIFQRFLKSIQAVHRPNTVKGSRREEIHHLISYKNSAGNINVILLAIPIFLESVFGILIGTVNTVVLSGYSDIGVVATGTVNTMLNMFTVVFTAISTGASVVISNAIGAERTTKAERVAFSSLVSSFLISFVLCGICYFFADSIVTVMNLEGEAYLQAVDYLEIRSFSLIITAVTSMLLAIMRCYGYTKYTILSGITSSIVNTILCILVINNSKKLPVSVIDGVAVAGVIALACGLLVAVVAFVLLKLKLKLPESFKDYLKINGLILKIGVPAAISAGSYSLSIVFTNSFVALLGVEAVSARMYYTTILSYTYILSIALGNANSIFIGRLCGAARYDHAEKVNKFLVKITHTVNLSISLLVFLLRVPLLSIFTDDKNIIAMSLGVLLIDILLEQARAVSHIYEYALRGAGDVMLNMIVMVLSCWVFSVACSYFLGMTLKMGLIGFWIGLTLDEGCRAVFSYFRWRTGKWKGILKQ